MQRAIRSFSPDAGDVFTLYKDPALALQTQNANRPFKAVAFKASSDVVALDLMQGVDNMATVDIGGPKEGVARAHFVAAQAMSDLRDWTCRGLRSSGDRAAWHGR